MTSGRLSISSGVGIVISICISVLSCAFGLSLYNALTAHEHIEEPTADERFVSDRGGDFDIIIDADTGVTYLVVERGRGGTMRMSMCPLLNPDGTPFVSEVD